MTMDPMRELDALVAERVLGYHVERIKPNWYPHEVWLFFAPGERLVVYSLDENACNAMMHRNGKDSSEGTAPPLPNYSGEDWEEAQEIILKLQESQMMLSINWAWSPEGEGDWWCVIYPHSGPSVDGPYADSGPEAICRAALEAVGNRNLSPGVTQDSPKCHP